MHVNACVAGCGEVLNVISRQHMMQQQLLAALPPPPAEQQQLASQAGASSRRRKQALAGSLSARLQRISQSIKAAQECLASGQPPAGGPVSSQVARLLQPPFTASQTQQQQQQQNPIGTSQHLSQALAGNQTATEAATRVPLHLQVLTRPQYDAHMLKFTCNRDGVVNGAVHCFLPIKSAPVDIVAGSRVTVHPPWHIVEVPHSSAPVLLAHAHLLVCNGVATF